MIRGRTLGPTCTFTPCSRGGSGAANTRRGPGCLRKQNWRANSAAGLTPPRGRSGHSNARGWPGGCSDEDTYRTDRMLIQASHDAPSRLRPPRHIRPRPFVSPACPPCTRADRDHQQDVVFADAAHAADSAGSGSLGCWAGWRGSAVVRCGPGRRPGAARRAAGKGRPSDGPRPADSAGGIWPRRRITAGQDSRNRIPPRGGPAGPGSSPSPWLICDARRLIMRLPPVDVEAVAALSRDHGAGTAGVPAVRAAGGPDGFVYVGEPVAGGSLHCGRRPG